MEGLEKILIDMDKAIRNVRETEEEINVIPNLMAGFVIDEIQAGAKGYATFEEWYEHIQEYSARLKILAQNKSTNPDAVTLATLHSSKGLEFENVYIIDANEGIMPYKKAVLEKDIEEERRLFYVGMTRAKTNLSIYSVKSVNDKTAMASRFIGECKEKN